MNKLINQSGLMPSKSLTKKQALEAAMLCEEILCHIKTIQAEGTMTKNRKGKIIPHPSLVLMSKKLDELDRFCKKHKLPPIKSEMLITPEGDHGDTSVSDSQKFVQPGGKI